jgi:hypothetical protein
VAAVVGGFGGVGRGAQADVAAGLLRRAAGVVTGLGFQRLADVSDRMPRSLSGRSDASTPSIERGPTLL